MRKPNPKVGAVQRSQALMLLLVLVVSLTSLHAVGQHSVGGISPEYRKWLQEDVAWIITTPERRQFKLLNNDKQRAQFVVAFWERRNPTPGNKENPFKQEHYKRMAFANEHFAAQVAGWRTDRGRIYIVYGPPDSIAKKPQEVGKPPEEVWTYIHMTGGGENVSVRFVDDCFCGAYEIVGDLPNSKWRNDVPGIF
jgi:GWxTD domain-containing protein